jgi:hypothetical protein
MGTKGNDHPGWGTMKPEKMLPRLSLRPVVWWAGLVCLLILAAGCSTEPSAPPELPVGSDLDADSGLDDSSRTLDSLREVDEYPLYTMTFYGDYEIDGIAHTGSSQQLSTGMMPGHACSTIIARNERGEVLMGRNFDWIHRASLLLYTDSPTGYASVSMVDIAYMGFEDGIPADADKTPLLDTPGWPMDGMNEHGLAVSQMSVPRADLTEDPERHTYGSLEVIRLLLDDAATVSEAIDLVSEINIDWEGGPTLHYLVADASGDSAVIEFVGGEMVVTREQVPWQIATNFTLYGTSPSNRGNLCWRYGAAEEILSPANGQLSDEAFLETIASLSGDWGQSETMWTVVYNLTAGKIEVVMGRDFTDVDTFSLEMIGDSAGR